MKLDVGIAYERENLSRGNESSLSRCLSSTSPLLDLPRCVLCPSCSLPPPGTNRKSYGLCLARAPCRASDQVSIDVEGEGLNQFLVNL